jgi:hypothetical protein
MFKYTARIPLLASSFPLLGFRRAFFTDNNTTGELMSFLQQSDLKKHLSTRSGNMSTRHDEAMPTEGSRVILRDGNLIMLPPPILGEELVDTARIDRANA